MNKTLPPGQQALGSFPRFGLSQFANRFPAEAQLQVLPVDGCVATPVDIAGRLTDLTRVEQRSDFHCVTTWSKTGLLWGGFRFSDVYRRLIVPMAKPTAGCRFIAFHSEDGYRSILPLEYLLADDVLLADRLDDKPLGIEHGAPLRLVAPAHYGYMNPKHLLRLHCAEDDRSFKPPGYRFMAHPLARVAHEERGRGLPGWCYRYLYRPLVKPTIRQFAQATAEYHHHRKT